MKPKFELKKVLQYTLPSVISLLVLFLISYFLKGTLGGDGTSTTVIYIMALFIAGGYFFVSAVLLHLMKLLKAMVPSTEEKVEDMKKQQEYLKRLKKNIERRYYFKKDLDEPTFRHELQEIARREIELEEKIAQLTPDEESTEKPKKEDKKK